MGTSIARHMEEILNLPHGWMDTDHSSASDPFKATSPTITGLLDSLREKLADLPDPLKKAVADLVTEYLRSPDPETGRTVAAAIERIANKDNDPVA